MRYQWNYHSGSFGLSHRYHPSTHIRADSRFVPSQWETALLCNAVSHWLGASLESALHILLCHSTGTAWIPKLPWCPWTDETQKDMDKFNEDHTRTQQSMELCGVKLEYNPIYNLTSPLFSQIFSGPSASPPTLMKTNWWHSTRLRFTPAHQCYAINIIFFCIDNKCIFSHIIPTLLQAIWNKALHIPVQKIIL